MCTYCKGVWLGIVFSAILQLLHVYWMWLVRSCVFTAGAPARHTRAIVARSIAHIMCAAACSGTHRLLWASSELAIDRRRHWQILKMVYLAILSKGVQGDIREADGSDDDD